MDIVLLPSTKKGKKWMVVFETGEMVHFGAEGYDDYTTHGDIKRKQLFLKRFRTLILENRNDFHSPMFWSMMLLWNKPTMKESIDYLENKYDVKIIRP